MSALIGLAIGVLFVAALRLALDGWVIGVFLEARSRGVDVRPIVAERIEGSA